MKRSLYKWTADIKELFELCRILNSYLMHHLFENQKNFKRGRVYFNIVEKKVKNKDFPRKRIMEFNRIESIEFHGRIEFKTKG